MQEVIKKVTWDKKPNTQILILGGIAFVLGIMMLFIGGLFDAGIKSFWSNLYNLSVFSALIVLGIRGFFEGFGEGKEVQYYIHNHKKSRRKRR